VLHYTFRPVGKLRNVPHVTSNVRAGDTVVWTNENTGERFENIVVLQVNKTVGAAMLRGYRGKAVRGRLHIETFGARLDQLTLTKRGA
jgi:hypothetical protein